MSEDNWLLSTIQAKSDQLNAVDLVGGPITVAIAKVSKCDGEQPVAIDIGTPGRPYKPCKSMRRVLIACWGANPVLWIGRQMTLFCDPAVKWAGESVGGIRISHLSHLGGDKKDVQLNESKHKKITWTVFNIETETKSTDERVAKAVQSLQACDTIAKLERTWKNCGMLFDNCDDTQKAILLGTKESMYEIIAIENTKGEP